MSTQQIQIGDKYGYLTIIEKTDERKNKGEIVFKCKCDCGNIVYRSSAMIRQSLVKGCLISCGCKAKHGRSIGKEFANDERRKQLAREGVGQYDGTCVAQLQRKKINKNNQSGVRGVHYSTRDKCWKATLTIRGKEYRYSFKDLGEAIACRKRMEKMYFEPVIKSYKEFEESEKE